MTPTAAAPSPPTRRRPFGVIVICLLLLFQAAILALAAWGLVVLDLAGSGKLVADLRVFGVDLSFVAVADAVRIVEAGLIALLVMALLQVVLVFFLRRIGWVLTMLVVGTNLAIHLFLIWRGQPTDTLSMAVLAVAALYLNQSDVRRAFGIGAGRIETALARSDEATREPA